MYALLVTLLAALLISAAGAGAGAGAGVGRAEARNACRAWGHTQAQKLKAPQARKAIACFLNSKRRNHGLGKLEVMERLNDSSQYHSRYMRRHGCFAHECGGEPTLDQRLGRAGYLLHSLLSWVYGENIAWGERTLSTPKRIVDAWMRSPGHRHNILNGRFRDLGIGFARGKPNNRHAAAGIYTTDFGYRLLG